jgi:hypothetical protein
MIPIGGTPARLRFPREPSDPCRIETVPWYGYASASTPRRKIVAKFRIWCRADEIAAGQHLAVVSAIPDLPMDDATLESESRLLTTREDAIEACETMVASFRRRIESRGDEVSLVERV